MSSALARLTGETRRELIVDAALEVFAERGFGSARTREIARRAGISETLIFQHFRTKGELYDAVLARLIASHPAEIELRTPIAAQDDFAVLYTVALHALSHIRQDRRLLRLSIMSALERVEEPSSARAARPLAEDRMERRLADYLEERTRAGALAVPDPALAARLLIGAIGGFAISQETSVLGPPLTRDDEQVARTLASVFLDGFRTGQTR